jgi:hypothetical protein
MFWPNLLSLSNCSYCGWILGWYRTGAVHVLGGSVKLTAYMTAEQYQPKKHL